MFQTKVVEKIKTHILYSIAFFFKNRSVYEITWKNIVQPDRPQTTIWRMRITYRIIKATNTHTEHVIVNDFSTATMVTRTRVIATLYVHCLSSYKIHVNAQMVTKFLINNNNNTFRSIFHNCERIQLLCSPFLCV